jgi:hypothetical protein
MKIINRVLITILVIGIVLSCSKDEGGSSNNVDSNLILYKNQTGDINANALQAQYKDSQGVLNFYGNFDAESNPTLIRTLTYQKTNNDTIVNLIIDPLTSRVNSSYTLVNGVKSDVVIKFDYPNDTHMSVSFHQYDWDNNSSEIIYGVNLQTSFYTTNKSSNTKKAGLLSLAGNTGWKIGSLLSGVIVAEAVGAVAGGFSLGLFSGIGTVAAAAISAPLLATAAALAIAVAIIPSDAFSSEIVPSDLPYPDDTPIENPVTAEEDPTPNVENPCTNSGLEVILGVDPGNLIVAIVNGDSANYKFRWSTGETVTRSISHSITVPGDGIYYVLVEDDNGCLAFGSVVIGDVRRKFSIDYNYDCAAGGAGATGFLLELKDNNEVVVGGPYATNEDLINAYYYFPSSRNLNIIYSHYYGSGSGGPLGSICLIEILEISIPYNYSTNSLLEGQATIKATLGYTQQVNPCGDKIEGVYGVCSSGSISVKPI